MPALRNSVVGPRIRVLIVDDLASVRNALETSLSTHEDIEVVGGAASGAEAVSLCGTLQFDVVLMDLLMPIMDGITATRLIRQQCPEVQVVALTISSDPDLRQQVLDAGAFCCLQKGVPSQQIADCLRTAKASAGSASS